MAKKTISNQEIDTIGEYIKEGVDLETASHASGISIHLALEAFEEGYYEKVHIDGGGKLRKTKTQSFKLYSVVVKARAESIIESVKKVKDSDDWKAAKWLLETTAPNLYSQKAATMIVEGNRGELE